jgi:hypothetical protein
MVNLICFSICAPFSFTIGALCAAPTWLVPRIWLKVWRIRLWLRILFGILAFVIAYLLYTRASAAIIWRNYSPEYVQEAWIRQIVPAPLRTTCISSQKVCDDLAGNPFPDVTLVFWNLLMSSFSGAVGAFTARAISKHRLSRSP